MDYKINIYDFNESELYINTGILKYINSNLIFEIDYEKGEFYIFVQKYNKNNEEEYTISRIQTIEIDKQKTGYGYKHFFKCPTCGHRRQFLYMGDSLYLTCRKCIGRNVYKARTNIYDENIENIIKYKIVQQLKLLRNPIPKVCILDLPSGIPEKPRYMRYDKYSLIHMKITFLTWMYWSHVSGEQEFTVSEINEMLEESNTRFVYEHMLFPEFYLESYKRLQEYDIE